MVKILEKEFELIDQESILKDESLTPLIVVFITTALSLTFCNYFGQSQHLKIYFNDPFQDSPNRVFFGKCYWALIVFLGYVILPCITIYIFKLGKIQDLGLNFGNFLRHFKIYLLLYIPVLIGIVIVSYDPVFQKKYPFLKEKYWISPFWFFLWELIYAFQFFCVEFFFRGYLLHIPKRRIGSAAIFVMIIPYCMIHFSKPFPETLGAIIGGIVLGFLSLKTKSIWGGVWIHIMVAWSMDFFSIFQKGLLSKLFG